MFEAFVTRHLGSATFETEPDDPRTDLFHASLVSSKALFGFTGDTRNRAGQAFKLHAGFVEDARPNALADTWRSEHFIGMHTPLFVSVNEFAMFCFTQSTFFPDVGNSKAETSPKPWDDQAPGLWLLNQTKKGLRVDDEHSRALIPDDGERFALSQYLAMLMARFTWLHELSHCFNGHVDLAKTHKIAPRLYELADGLSKVSVGKRAVSPEARATLKCLEFDADSSALWGSVNIQLNNLENLEGIAALDMALRLRLTLFGAYSMIWLIDEYQSYLDAQENETHPSASLRLQNLQRVVAERVLPLADGAEILLDDVLRQFDVMRSAIPQMYSQTHFADLRADDQMAALDAFDERSADLKSQLRDYEFSADY